MGQIRTGSLTGRVDVGETLGEQIVEMGSVTFERAGSGLYENSFGHGDTSYRSHRSTVALLLWHQSTD
jgi:hypothetical protein